MRRHAFLLTAVLMVVATGCNTVSVRSTQYLGVPNDPPTDPATVQILRTQPMMQNVRLGKITVEPQGNPTKEQIEAKLQAAAAKMGANAVVIVVDRTMVTGATVVGPLGHARHGPGYHRRCHSIREPVKPTAHIPISAPVLNLRKSHVG